MQTYYGRHEPAWIGGHHRPYFVDSPFVGFHDPHPFIQDEPYAFSPYGAPFAEQLPRIPRSASAMPAYGHYTDSPFLEPLGRHGPLRSSSAIPAYAYPEAPFHDVPHGLARSSSSIPSFREPRPKQHKVAPVSTSPSSLFFFCQDLACPKLRRVTIFWGFRGA